MHPTSDPKTSPNNGMVRRVQNYKGPPPQEVTSVTSELSDHAAKVKEISVLLETLWGALR